MNECRARGQQKLTGRIRRGSRHTSAVRALRGVASRRGALRPVLLGASQWVPSVRALDGALGGCSWWVVPSVVAPSAPSGPDS